MTTAEDINRLFAEAAAEDRRHKAATPPRKPRNRLYAANLELQKIASERRTPNKGNKR